MARQKLSNTDCIKFYKKIINLIKTSKEGFFTIRRLRGAMGYCAWEDGISLDYRRELIPTLIHECVHYLRPDWNETQVLYAEKRIINSITPKQAVNLLKTFISLF